MAERRDPLELLERGAALEVLAEAWGSVNSGRHAILSVTAAAGMGKTALLSRAVGTARRAGVSVAEVAGLEVEADVPFALGARLARALVGKVTAADQRVMVDAPVAALLRDGSAASAGGAVTVGLARLVEGVARHRPLAIVVDDLHWADLPSVEFLRYVAARCEGVPVALVLATRSLGADGERAREFDALRRMTTAEVELAPLSAAAVGRLLRTRLGARSAGSAHACRELTGGNPLLVAEVAEELVANGPLDIVAGQVTSMMAAASLPSVPRRLTRVSPHARELAKAAAVLGGGFSLDVACELADLPDASVRRAVAELRDAAIFHGSEVAFTHPLVARSVAASIPEEERAVLHRRAAGVRRAGGDHPLVVGRHLLAADRRGSCETVDGLLTAAVAARQSAQPGLALRFADRAASEPPPADHRAAVDRERALAAAESGDDRWRELVEAALEGSSDRAALLLRVGRGLYGASRPGDAAIAFEWGKEEAAGTPELELLLLGRAAFATVVEVGRSQRRSDLVDALARAVDQAETRESPEWREAAGCLTYQRLVAGAPADAVVDLVTAALDPTRTTGREVLDVVTYFTAVQSASMIGASVEADAIERASRVYERLGVPALAQTARAYRGALHLRQGRVRAAVADLEEAYRVGELSRILTPKIVTERALALYEYGTLADAAAALDLPPGEGYDATGYYNGYLRARGIIRAACGDPHGGLGDLLECGDREATVLADGAIAIPWRFDAALVLSRLGRSDDARRFALPGLEAARRQGVPFRIAHGLRALAAASAGPERECSLREALAVLEGTPWGLERLEVNLALADALADRRESAEARVLLTEAADAAHHSGAHRLAQIAVAGLRQLGGRPRRAATTGQDALTPAERDVIRLVAEGHTNAAIAEHRGVSTKAIEHHLTNAFRKLGVRSRVELIIRHQQLVE